MTAAEVLSRVRISGVYQVLTGIRPRRTGRDTWRGPATWRGGDHPGAVALDDQRGCWYDHVTGTGGGVLDLVQRANGLSRTDALQYLAQAAGAVLDDRRASREQRRAIAAQRGAAEKAAEDIERWRDALILELDRRKLVAVETGEDEALTRAACLQYRLTNGQPEVIVREYLHARRTDPAEVARFIAAGREHQAESRRIASQVVLLLAAEVRNHAAR